MKNEGICQSAFPHREKYEGARVGEGLDVQTHPGGPQLPAGHDQGVGKEARPKTVPVLGDAGDGKLEKSFVSCQLITSGSSAILERRQPG